MIGLGSWKLGPQRVLRVAAIVVVAVALAACDASTNVALLGRAVSADGAGVGSVTVAVYSADTESLLAQVTTDSRGAYRLSAVDVPPGDYRLSAGGQWHGSGATTWDSAATITIGNDPVHVDLVVSSAATFTGTLVDPATHDPVAGQVVVALDLAHDVIAASITDESGEFALGVATPSAVTIAVWDPLLSSTGVLGGETAIVHDPLPGSLSDLGALELITATSVSVNLSSTCARLSSGAVSCWGTNDDGQLADSTIPGNSPLPVLIGGIADATDVAVGTESVCALHATGAVSCWGNNDFGQLGDGTTTSSTSPVTVTGITDATDIAVGSHSGASACATHSSGAVSCWGNNDFGQLGDGTATSSTSPVTVTGITDAVAVTLSDTFGTSACALHATGAVSCWGVNDFGELGDGTTTSSPVPVSVTGITDAIGVDAGSSATCATHSSGAVSCWGYNGYGGLGDGTTDDSSVPVLVTGITDAIGVDIGVGVACATHATGAVSCWGFNVAGVLGNGTDTSSSVPVPVTGITDALAVHVGGSTACALHATGAISCWGSNADGQLGDGTTTDAALPVAVLGVPSVISGP